MEKIINNVADLIAILRTAKNGGQFATLYGEHATKFNVFPNDEFCSANGITLASGKGSKALNEPFRFNGMTANYRFSVQFHFGQDYDRTLEKLGLCRSENGSANETDHFGGIAMGYPTTNNVCIIYMQGNYNGIGYFDENGNEITNAETLAYIKGYKSASKPNAVEYRTIGVRNVKALVFGGVTYKVQIDSISPDDYKMLKANFAYANVG